MNQLLIYSDRQSNRLLYMAKVLSERWGANVIITTDLSTLSENDIAIYNYSSNIEVDLLSTVPSQLLFEKRIQAQELNINRSKETPYLFSNSDFFLGFDPLAAVFFLLSRYEEYLPHRKDEHDRFTSESSILFEIDCLQRPLVDLYLNELRLALLSKYPMLELKKGVFKTDFTFDVDQLFLYESKGIAKAFLGATKDLVLDRKSFAKRIDVNFGGVKDPLNIYERLESVVSKSGNSSRFFFQVGESSRFDNNNPVHLPLVRNSIHEISLKANIGLHPSYFTSDDQDLLATELERLKRITNQEIQHSRQHYLRFNLPNTYRWLENIGVSNEYSMGFADINGFRAGTAYPFRFYDLGREEASGLTVHPFIFMDLLSVRNNDSIDSCIDEINSLAESMSSTGGVLSTTWHPEALIGFDVPMASMPLLDYCLQNTGGEIN